MAAFLSDSISMDNGILALLFGRLLLGGLASFLAIVVWSMTRDIAWMLIVIGTITSYAETIYSVLDTLGVAKGFFLGSVPLVVLILQNLPTVFYIIAFGVMISRKTRRR